MSIELDIYVDQGSDFSANFPPVTRPDGTVFNLTGYTAQCQIRRGYASRDAIQMVTTIPTPANGIINISMLNEFTAGLSPLRYVYDCIIISSGNVRNRVFDGLCIVNPGVTDKPNTNLLTPNIPDDWGGIVDDD